MRPATHGMSRSVEYRTWLNIRQRCYYPRDKRYAYYGGAGVTVCDRWRRSFENFIADMGRRPPGRYSIERLDNSKGYEPGNCIWLPTAKQNGHRRDTVYMTIGDRTQRLIDWAKETGLPAGLLRQRRREGIPAEQMLLPVGPLHKLAAKKNGRHKRCTGIRPSCNAGAAALCDFIRARGMSQREAATYLGISLSGLRLWYRGKSVPFRRIALRIEAHTGGAVKADMWHESANKKAA